MRNPSTFGLSPRRVAPFALTVAFAFVSSSCATVAPPVKPPVARTVPEHIMGRGLLDANALASFLLAHNPSLDPDRARSLCGYYVEESAREGVNADVAFAQMCLETGYLKFGGLVTPEMNNFCGLGSIGPGQPGNAFPDPQTGVRAHVQHLKAYGSPEPLALPVVDPRYKYVTPKGKAPAIAGLAGTWAADPEYGNKIASVLARLYAFA